MKHNFELTTVGLSHSLRKRIRYLSRTHKISQSTVIRELLRIGERHFRREAFRPNGDADSPGNPRQEQFEFNFDEGGHETEGK
jgi:hypothetical protein